MVALQLTLLIAVMLSTNANPAARRLISTEAEADACFPISDCMHRNDWDFPRKNVGPKLGFCCKGYRTRCAVLCAGTTAPRTKPSNGKWIFQIGSWRVEWD